MYLKKLNIKNYKCINELSVEFNKGVNIFIGENNSGKTAVLDALRVCLSYGRQQRDIWISEDDFHLDRKQPGADIEDIEFDLFFEIENDVEVGVYNDFLCALPNNKQELQIHFRYSIKNRSGLRKVDYKVWGGEKEGQSISPEVMQLIYFIHLDALRDAVHYLRPFRGSRLGELFSKMVLDEDTQGNLSEKVHKVLSEDPEWKGLIEQGKTKVNEHLYETTILGKEQNVEIDFLPYEFRQIVDNLRIQTPVYKNDALSAENEQKYLDLRMNGLGYNNLIFIATVLGDLEKQKESNADSYVALLIEEPEAHLHPQLQNIFFNYLNKLQVGFQIFITSHSPTMTAKADIDSLIVLQDQNDEISALPMKNSALDPMNKIFLKKFLDVTKSQLFFANGVILVEGISEALLIPIFSEIMGKEFNVTKNGIELVNINGVAFEHFGKLFNSEQSNLRLDCKCSILTDDDRDEDDTLSSRALKANDLAGGLLKVFLAENTFEYELFISGTNKNILLELFKELHPVAYEKIEQDKPLKEQAMSFMEKVSTNKAKTELAHTLAVNLELNPDLRKTFTIPTYIQNAIKWVVNGE